MSPDPNLPPKPVSVGATGKPAAQDARFLLTQLETQKLEIKQTLKGDDETYQYVQVCRRGHAAFFYTENPIGKTITPDKWFATYKRPDEPWAGVVLCQQCTKFDENGVVDEATEFPVQVDYMRAPRNTVRFIARNRFVYRFPKDADARKKVPMHRASLMGETASNYGVPNPDFPRTAREKSDMELARERSLHQQRIEEVARG